MTEPALRYVVTLPRNGAGHGPAKVVVVSSLNLPGPNGGWLYLDSEARIRVEILGNAARLLGPDGRVVARELWHAEPLPGDPRR